VVIVLVAAAMAVGTGILALRGRASGGDKITAEPSAVLPASDPVPAPPALATATAPTVVLAPEASATLAAPATAASTGLPPKPVAKAPTAGTGATIAPTAPSATAPQAPLPTQLGDLKLH
jgi:hypothetical protein